MGCDSDYFNPPIVGELNGQHVKLVQFQGEFVWHHHDQEDELFLVVRGRFRMDFRDRQEWIEEGESLIVPRGVEHRPVAEQQVALLLFERRHFEHRNVQDDALTRTALQRL